jgi:hypothetical protein
MAECVMDKIKQDCPCTYMSCSKRGKCCECVEYHNTMGQFPGCFFPPEGEKTYDRSYESLKRFRG